MKELINPPEHAPAGRVDGVGTAALRALDWGELTARFTAQDDARRSFVPDCGAGFAEAMTVANALRGHHERPVNHEASGSGKAGTAIAFASTGDGATSGGGRRETR